MANKVVGEKREGGPNNIFMENKVTAIMTVCVSP